MRKKLAKTFRNSRKLFKLFFGNHLKGIIYLFTLVGRKMKERKVSIYGGCSTKLVLSLVFHKNQLSAVSKDE
jgi:hypothetical protein